MNTLHCEFEMSSPSEKVFPRHSEFLSTQVDAYAMGVCSQGPGSPFFLPTFTLHKIHYGTYVKRSKELSPGYERDCIEDFI